jgi:hypothetical protein
LFEDFFGSGLRDLFLPVLYRLVPEPHYSLRRLLFVYCELLPLPAEGYVAFYYGVEILRVAE